MLLKHRSLGGASERLREQSQSVEGQGHKLGLRSPDSQVRYGKME